jgi:antibiotic biosynthesis monooxygenase (ABM) superfamily enzyme
LGALPFAFGTALLPWYVWLLLSGTLMVVVDYLTQTRVRGVVPLLETPRQTRLPRMRYVLLRLGLLWVTVLVVALVATTLLWGVGIQGLVAFLTVLVGSILLGAGLGYFLLPDIEGDYLPVSMRQRQP